MKQFLVCAAVIGWSAVALGQGARPADTPKGDQKANALDGTWTVVSIEKNGEPMKDAKDMTVTVKDNAVTCSGKDGKPAMSVRFEFTGPGQARVTMDEGATGSKPADADKPADTSKPADRAGTKQAVYVLTNDYLAVCVHDDKAGGTGGDRPAGGDRPGAITTSAPTAKTYCSIILKRGESK
jgi:uncharacterized protein (TIGR03067 family)